MPVRRTTDITTYVTNILLRMETEDWLRYAGHNCPFGESIEASEVWHRYRQYTTLN